MENEVILPPLYQQVEYIESTGTQWIDSGVMSSNDDWKFILQFQRTTNTRGVFLFGNTNGFNASLDNNYVYRATGQAITGITASNTSFDEVVVESLTTTNVVKISVNGTLTTGSYSNWNYNNELGVIGGGGYYQIGKYKSLSIYKNNILVRNFIPCYRKTDNEIGLYDLVNGVFYTNQGTGTFIKGPSIPLEPKTMKLNGKILGKINNRNIAHINHISVMSGVDN